MKAVVHQRYGSPDLLRLVERDVPVPGADQVLIQVHAVSLNGSDLEGLRGRPFYARLEGLRRPGKGILGSDVAGRVVAVGAKVLDFKPGDEVFGELPGYRGGFAEYACGLERTLLHKPAGLSFMQAAAIPQAGTIAWHGIVLQGRVQAGHKVLINGAGGGAGSMAIQLAKRQGAVVTGVDLPHRLDFMRSLGADVVLDATTTDFRYSGGRYDLILDLVASRGPASCLGALRPRGRYLLVGGAMSALCLTLLLGRPLALLTGKRFQVLAVPQKREHLAAITSLVLDGSLVPPIAVCFPLAELARAFHHMQGGLPAGKVLVTPCAELAEQGRPGGTHPAG
jgi:NADPH:quinone reductase-like Zn-dependent oxidoreductase